MTRAGCFDHRMGQAPLRLEPMIRSSQQILDRVLGKEVGSNSALGALGHRRFGSVFAKLKRAPLARRRVRPGASRTVKAVRLINLSEQLHTPQHARMTTGLFEHAGDGTESTRSLGVGLGSQLRGLRRRRRL